MTKIQVPRGMIEAIQEAWYKPVSRNDDHQKLILEAALQWLSDNPIVPTNEQIAAMYDGMTTPGDAARYVAVEFQRRMFLAEPEIPEGVRDLLSPTCQNLWQPSSKEYDAAVLEAFRRGQRIKG